MPEQQTKRSSFGMNYLSLEFLNRPERTAAARALQRDGYKTGGCSYVADGKCLGQPGAYVVYDLTAYWHPAETKMEANLRAAYGPQIEASEARNIETHRRSAERARRCRCGCDS